jgi:hypothetical protein
MDVGALSLLITEQGFAATMQKVAQVDAAAATVGAKPTEVKVTAPTVAPVTQALTKIQQTASAISGTPVTVRFTVPNATQAETALAKLRGELDAAVIKTQQLETRLGGLDGQNKRVGSSTDALNPKWRTAANGITALAFAASQGSGSFQSMALGAGLAATSLASMASGPIALWAAGIGAAVTIGATFIGILEGMSDSASHAATAVDEVTASIKNIRGATEAQAALTQALRDQAAIQKRLADETTRRNTAEPGTLASTPIAHLQRIRTLQKESEQANAIVLAAQHQLAVTTIAETTENAAAQREVVVQGLAAENAARDAAGKAALANEAARFATGQTSLDAYFAARLALIQASGAREIEVLQARQKALGEPVPGASAADAAKRAGEIRALGSQIQETEARIREETATTTDQRRAQRQALNKAVLGFELQEQEAAGDASKAKIAIAREEANEIARILVQRGATPAAANAEAERITNAKIALIEYNRVQQDTGRILVGIGDARTRIQQRVTAGLLTQQEGERLIADEERKRLPALEKMAAAMEAFALELKNPDLAAAARKLRTEMQQMNQQLSGVALGVGECARQRARPMVSRRRSRRAAGRTSSRRPATRCCPRSAASSCNSARRCSPMALLMAAGLPLLLARPLLARRRSAPAAITGPGPRRVRCRARGDRVEQLRLAHGRRRWRRIGPIARSSDHPAAAGHPRPRPPAARGAVDARDRVAARDRAAAVDHGRAAVPRPPAAARGALGRRGDGPGDRPEHQDHEARLDGRRILGHGRERRELRVQPRHAAPVAGRPAPRLRPRLRLRRPRRDDARPRAAPVQLPRRLSREVRDPEDPARPARRPRSRSSSG